MDGTYAPSRPTRFELAKSNGAFRVMTTLNITDAVVYRHLADAVLTAAIPEKVPGAYFSRRFKATPIGHSLNIGSDEDYDRFYPIWLRYNQYRSQTLLANGYHFVVVTDISNYFESINHDLLVEYLSAYLSSRRVSALLRRLLEAFRGTASHSPFPHTGLPTDELDGSRQLAHVFLFEHDHEMTEEVGSDSYVRWMDDHNIGAHSQTHARQIVNLLTRSLASRRLTLNAGKTRVLSPSDVALHFQLDANEKLDEWEATYGKTSHLNQAAARQSFVKVWNEVSRGPSAGIGNWPKVLRRVYAGAIKADTSRLERRALQDLIAFPELDERIFTYFAARNRGAQLLALFREYCERGESLYEGTEAVFFQTLLTLNPGRALRSEITALCWEFARGEELGARARPLARANAILALYWFGAEASALTDCFSADEARILPKEAARCWVAVAVGLSPDSLDGVRTRLFGHAAEDVVQMCAFLDELVGGRIESLGNYKSRRRRWPAAGWYYDARSWLMLELGSHSPNKPLRGRMRGDAHVFSAYARTWPERQVLRRVNQNLGVP